MYCSYRNDTFRSSKRNIPYPIKTPLFKLEKLFKNLPINSLTFFCCLNKHTKDLSVNIKELFRHPLLP